MKTFQNVYEALLGSLESDFRLAFRMDIWKQIVFCFFALHIVLVAASPADLDTDIGWQIAQGRWSVQHRAFYRTDELNYPNAHQPVIDEYPLFQLLCYGADLIQPYGTTTFRVILCLALFLPLMFWEKRLPPLPGDFLFPFSLILAASFIDFALRAQLISLLFTAIFVITLVKIRDAPTWRRVWPLYVFQVCWVNMHSGFILGPLLAVTIGFEIIFSQLLRGIVNRRTIYSWCFVWVMLSFSCLVNPYGAARLSLPVYQDNLALIRIYVAEMHPLTGPALDWGYACAATGFLLIMIARVSYGLRLPLGVIAMALIIFNSSLSTAKYWSFFVYFIPLILLAARIITRAPKEMEPANSDTEPRFPILGPIILMAVSTWLGYSCLRGVPELIQSWSDYRHNRTIQPTAATGWIRLNHLKGNFMNRAEVGGWLQQHFSGLGKTSSSLIDDGYKTYCDAGLGKFSPAFIQEIALLGDRPNLLPILLARYRSSDLIVITSLQSCYWPCRLKALRYRLVFYSSNSAVWLKPSAIPRPNLEEISPSNVWAGYQKDRDWLKKADPLTFLRSLISLHGSGCPDEAAAIWQTEPAEMHRTDDYWLAVCLLCEDGSPTDSLWDGETAQLFYPEAEGQQKQPKPNQENGERFNFMALSKLYNNQDKEALAILDQARNSGVPDNPKLSLLRLKIIARGGRWKEALELARHRDQFDPLNGEYWSLLARCLEHNQDDPAAAEAWQKALDLAPDVPGVLEEAAAFASRTHDDELLQSVRKWTGD